MGLIAPAIQTVSPNFMEPDTIMQYSQTSSAYELLPKGMPRVKLDGDTLVIYAKRLDLRTKAAAGQTAYNMLPTIEPAFSLISTPTYLSRVRFEYDHHDAAAANRWGHAITQLYRLGSQQAHFQFMRTALLFGINPALGEGLINAAGSTALNLPADQYGNATIQTYDNGNMASLILNLIAQIKVRTNQMGLGRPVTIIAPQEVMAVWQYSIVQLVDYQRSGAGSDTTAGTVKGIGGVNGDDIVWGCDDTLKGKGAGGTDLIIIAMPEIAVPDAPNEIDTNVFATLTPGFRDTTVQYCDMIAPREITVPLAGGAVDTLTEHRISSGWPIRPEAITLLSATF